MKRTLDICISTYNRGRKVYSTVQCILDNLHDDVGVVVQNDASTDDTIELLCGIKDDRLVLINNNESVAALKGVMYNWYKVLTYASATYVLYLNDRDDLNIQETKKLISFLEQNIYAGGVCNSIFRNKIFSQGAQSFENVPYYGYHPSGMVFNLDYLKRINDLDLLFTKEQCYIHPHDLVLSELSKYGRLFIFSKHVWNMASQESFKSNKSFLYHSNTNIESFWFHPTQRLVEYEKFIIHMKKMGYSETANLKCLMRMSRRYLFYCTYNYKNFVTDPGQTSHYGIEQQKVNFRDLCNNTSFFINGAYVIVSKHNFKISKPLFYIELYFYFMCMTLFLPAWHLYKKIIERLKSDK